MQATVYTMLSLRWLSIYKCERCALSGEPHSTEVGFFEWERKLPQHRIISRCQAKLLTSRHVHMHRAIFYILNTLRKLMVRAEGFVFSVRQVRV